MYKPLWNEEFRRLNPDPRKMDANGERKAVDVMIDCKEQEMKQSPTALKWESDRKNEWHKYLKQKSIQEKNHQLKVDEAKKNLIALVKTRKQIRERRKK